MSIKKVTSLAIAARNLALAEKEGLDIVTPCSSCYTILNKAHKYLSNSTELLDSVNTCLAEAGLKYNCTVRVRHPIDVLVNDIGLEIISMYVKKPLDGLRVANYYGCQIVRPDKGFDDKENPTSMENLFQTIGAEEVYFPNKLRCCGGMLMTTFEDAALKLSEEILDCAVENKADCIVTTCPLCQMNLEAYQDKINKKFNKNYKMPILFFTQVLGIALGLSEDELGIDKNFYKCEKLDEIYKKKVVEEETV
jgi:heterodisulfide reductase subunit B